MRKTDRIISMVILVLTFAVYQSTMANTVSFFDSGELISGAATLGISHPPGYPLYVLTGYLFSKIPMGNIAFRVNMLSAFFGALAVVIMYRIAVSVLEGIFAANDDGVNVRLSALSASLVFAFSLNHWGQTNMAEVYAMNTFFIALLLYILIRWRNVVLCRTGRERRPSARLLYLFAFLFGLGSGDHHTILVAAPVAFFVISVTMRRLFLDIRCLSTMLFFFCLGFSVYLYMPVRAVSDLTMNWGDPETLGRFRWMFLREGYPRNGVSRDWSLFLEQLKTINLLGEFTIIGFVFAVAGIARFLLKGWFYAGITVIVVLVLSVGIVVYGNPPKENVFLLEAFHTPSYMVFALWIGVAAKWLFDLLSAAVRRFSEGGWPDVAATVLWVAVLVALPSVVFSANYSNSDRSRNFVSFDYAVNELKSLSQNAILFTWGDSGAFPLWYLQFVERYRPDVLLLHTPHLGSDWYVDGIPQLSRSRIRHIPPDHRSPGIVVGIIARENLGIRESFIDYSSRYSFPIRGMRFIPHGIIYRHARGKERVDTSVWDTYVMRGFFSDRILRDLDIGKAISIYGFCRFDTGVALLSEGRRSEALQQFAEALKIVPGLRGRIRAVLGGSK